MKTNIYSKWRKETARKEKYVNEKKMRDLFVKKQKEKKERGERVTKAEK